jgi:raffinose/stachyose/melibiose transport system permease protein
MSKATITLRAPGMRTTQLALKLASQLILAFFTLVIVYPVVWMAFASLKTKPELATNIWGLPQSFTWENYTSAWEAARMGYALTNSLIVSLGTTALVVGMAGLAGYALAHFRFRFAKAIFLLFVLTIQAGAPVIPLYVMLTRLHMTDSYQGLILPMVAGGLPLAIFIFYAFFQSIPRELREAAVVDGCTDFGAFWRIVLPISGPAIATVAILQFLGAWNEYFLSLILIRSPNMRTLPLAIQVFFYDFGRSEWTQAFAALTMGSLPMIIVYVVLQRQFIQGLTSGALKA